MHVGASLQGAFARKMRTRLSLVVVAGHRGPYATWTRTHSSLTRSRYPGMIVFGIPRDAYTHLYMCLIGLDRWPRTTVPWPLIGPIEGRSLAKNEMKRKEKDSMCQTSFRH